MKTILKGMLIGIGKVIPGVSGSIIAISLGVYEKAIYALNNIFKRDNFIFIMKLAIGLIISITLVSKAIVFMLNNYYSATIFVFVGMILGSMKEVNNNVEKKYWYLTLISFLIIISISFIGSSNTFYSNNIIINVLFFILAGVIDAVSMIIPGLSGTALLMLIGAYDRIMYIFSNILNINMMLNNVLLIIPFGVGLIIGVLISLKLIKFLFKNYYTQTYNVILGLLLGSVFMMLKSAGLYFIGILFTIISFYVTKKINHFFD